MTISFAKSLKRSTKLIEEKRILTSTSQIYSILPIEESILMKKEMNHCKPLVKANLRNNLQSLRLVNLLLVKLTEEKKMKFSYENSEHIKLLNDLWDYLKPNIRRSLNTKIGGNNNNNNHNHNNPWISSDWGEIGFQGKDPSTDFRGMGLLGLLQLVYFAKNYPKEARELLFQSQTDKFFFPFSATGINMTAFLMELIEKTHFHTYLINQMDRILLEDATNSVEGCSDDPKCIEFAMNLVHDLYSQIFLSFGKEWIASNPKDLMEFPKIFASFKDSKRLEYSSL